VDEETDHHYPKRDNANSNNAFHILLVSDVPTDVLYSSARMTNFSIPWR
jgi:hypothetical protein